MRMGVSAHSGAWGLMVRGDSPIKTIYDIGQDTRVALWAPASAPVCAVLAWLQLNKAPIRENPEETEWNVKIIPFDSWEANLKSVAEGAADVAFVDVEPPLVKEAAVGPHGIRFLQLPAMDDPEGLMRFRKVMPFFTLAPAPEMGVKEIWGVTTMIGIANFWCHPDFDTNLGYKFTKWFDENYELYKDKGNKLKSYTFECLRQAVDSTMAPVHDGTIKYFKEKGLWTQAHNARQEYNLKLMTWYCEAWETALGRADAKGIPVSSASEAWIKLWSDYKKEIQIPGYWLMTDAEIQEGLKVLENLGR